jgi:uncharacterized membrane protein HdeD (DUF308 family)
LVLRGAVGVLFGFVALILPELTLAALIILFGAFSLVDGVLGVVAAIGALRHGWHWIAMLIGGLLGVAVGILAFVLPGLTALSLVYLIAAWSIVTGVAEMVAAMQSAGGPTPRWLIGLSGVLSIVFGLLLFVSPGAGALSLIWLIGIYAIIDGVMLVVGGFRSRADSGIIRESFGALSRA